MLLLTCLWTHVHHVHQALYAGHSCSVGCLITVQPVICGHHMRAGTQHIDAVKGRQQLCCAPQMLENLQRQLQAVVGLYKSACICQWDAATSACIHAGMRCQHLHCNTGSFKAAGNVAIPEQLLGGCALSTQSPDAQPQER